MLTVHNRFIFAFLLCFVFFMSSASSQQIFLKVVDQHNQPLKNAVIELMSFPSKLRLDNSTYIMDQVYKSFDPRVLVVPQNSFVSFPNSDDFRHHVYSFSATKTFELKLYAGKDKSPLLFEKAGVVVLGCNIHDSMVGYIYVAEYEQVYQTDDEGVVTLQVPITNVNQLSVWHPDDIAGVEHRKLYSDTQFTLIDNTITFTVITDVPAPRDSFENLVNHDH